MRHLIPTLFVALALSPCANGSEKLKYESTAQKAGEIGFSSNLVRAAISNHNYKYHLLEKFESGRESYNYMIKTTGKGHTQIAQNPLNCFNSLAPDFCWHTGLAEVNNTQAAADLAFEYYKNSAPVSEEVCSAVSQPCDYQDNTDETQVNVTTGKKSGQQKKTVSAGSQVKLNFFSISLIF